MIRKKRKKGKKKGKKGKKRREKLRKEGNRSKKEGKFLYFVSLFNIGPYDKKGRQKTGKNWKKN